MWDRAESAELVEEKETPATKHSRPQNLRSNNRQIVEDTSEEEAGDCRALILKYPFASLMADSVRANSLQAVSESRQKACECFNLQVHVTSQHSPSSSVYAMAASWNVS